MMVFLVIFLVSLFGFYGETNGDGCSRSCGIGTEELADGSYGLCNVQPCPFECDSCVLVNTVGYLPNILDCRCFYQCHPVKAKKHGMFAWKVTEECCAPCLHWDEYTCSCDYACCDTCTNGCILFYENVTTDDPFIYCYGEEYIEVDYNSFIVTEGANWLIYDDCDSNTPQAVTPGYYASTGTARCLEKNYIKDVGTWSSWSAWTDCYAVSCLDGQPSTEGTKRQYQHTRPLNWCDRECPCRERNASCPVPADFWCPTAFTRPACPVFFWMKFNGNIEDEFGASVLQPIGTLGFNDSSTPDCITEDDMFMCGVFDHDMLQVDYFVNWFTYPHNTQFTISFWFLARDDEEGVLFNTGCDLVDDLYWIEASFTVWLEGNEVWSHVVLEDETLCGGSIGYTGGEWQFATILFNGNELHMHGGFGCEEESTTACQGFIYNNKCPLMIGYSAELLPADVSHYAFYEGMLDEVKIYDMGEELHNDDVTCCPCPL